MLPECEFPWFLQEVVNDKETLSWIMTFTFPCSDSCLELAPELWQVLKLLA